MNSALANQLLSQMLAIHSRSLPMYLSYAAPWKQPGGDKAAQTLQRIVADQRQTVDRLGKLLMENDGEAAPTEFPLSYTSLHYLSLDYLVTRMIERQQQDIASLERCADQLASSSASSMSQAVARRAVQAARTHLEWLQELHRERLPAG